MIEKRGSSQKKRYHIHYQATVTVSSSDIGYGQPSTVREGFLYRSRCRYFQSSLLVLGYVPATSTFCRILFMNHDRCLI